ncbi:hypothetical protein M758_3G183500 [Ceratodon purpureus]|uniref:Zinc finger PHD-type domain-containing protein n=1 Tax=Ceratodon purpureus TaxID=3225 RepID=A0A8T0IMK3_CERPU|nr:hypothetical protein KC19_3G183200 [Ceratodon purpureus]KAG0623565.1 hypothetical protein M758_3G183500 [Ceratodon purpureus]
MDRVRGSTVECNMCGDVGFPDKLQQCKACVRVQHIYCSISKEGLETGSWVCDWCRLEKQRKKKPQEHADVDMKVATQEFSQCTLKSPDNGLKILIEAVLSTKEEFLPPLSAAAKVTGEPSPTANCGSNCSSSVESEKALSSGWLGDASSNLRKQRVTTDTSISDEEGSTGTVQNNEQRVRTTGAACVIKRSPSSLRCRVRSSKETKQKVQLDVKALKTQLSLPSRHNAPAPLKRLSSLKVLSRSNNTNTNINTMRDEQPRGLVRRYKSLSDIC